MSKTILPAMLEFSSLNEIADVGNSAAIIFNRYFSHIKANTSEFQKAVLSFLNSNWNKNSELLIAKLQTFSGRLASNIYQECILATKDYINSHDFAVEGRYETTSYFYGAIQYNSESCALKELNQKLDQLIQKISQKTMTWIETFENLYAKTASTLLSAFNFAKENPFSVITGLLYGQTILAAAFPAVFELSSLDETNGFSLNGVAVDDRSGIAVSSGDVNGDGYADIIIGAYAADPGGRNGAGTTYVVFGEVSGWTNSLELSSLNGTNGFSINGVAEYDLSGLSVSSGDVNGDGYADIIIGAQSADPGGRNKAGTTYIVFGKESGWTNSLELSNLDGDNGFSLNGVAEEDRSGTSVSSGDVNGDGYADIIIGAQLADPGGKDRAGTTYVVFGKASAWTSCLELSNLNGYNGFSLNGIAAGDESGYSVSSGDVNGDGYADLIIGAYAADPGGRNGAGTTYVVFGKASGWTSSLELSSLNGTNGFILNGVAAYDGSGSSVSSGDVNGDGYADLIIGAYAADPGGKERAGTIYVVFGKTSGWTSSLELSSLDGTNGFRLNGVTAEDLSGFSVSSGDVNGDGYADLIIGAHAADPGGKETAGITYVVFGKESGWTSFLELSSLDGTNGFSLNGVGSGDGSGYSVSSSDANGYADLIIGACMANPGGRSWAGITYVVFGEGNKVPVLTGSGGLITYTENDAPIIIDPAITIYDFDNTTLADATISIINNFYSEEDILAFEDQNGISGDYDDNIGILVLTGIESLENYQIALRSIQYNNTSDNPTFGVRIISFVVNDGISDSVTIMRNISVVPINRSPLTDNGISFMMKSIIIGGSILGFMTLVVIGLKMYSSRVFKQKLRKGLESAIETYNNGTSHRNSHLLEWAHQDILVSMAHEIFEQVQITGCFKYINEASMQGYLNAVVKIITELQSRNADLNLDQISSKEQSQLVKEISESIHKRLLPSVATEGCCSDNRWAYFSRSCFKTDISAERIEENAAVIAEDVNKSFKNLLPPETIGIELQEYAAKEIEGQIEGQIEGKSDVTPRYYIS